MAEAGYVRLLAPVLDTYGDSSVGLTGCRATGLANESCEYDLLLVREEKNPPSSVKVGNEYVDLLFLTEEEALAPSSPELAVSLASARPVRDTSLAISASVSAALESLSLNSQRCSESKLAAAIKAMGRVDESIKRQSMMDADFWLSTAGYDVASAWLYSRAQAPSPSHLLFQLRQLSRAKSAVFEGVARATGLEGASRQACQARLDSLGVLFDLKESVEGEVRVATSSLRVSYEIVQRKARALLDSSQPVDCYCFLGLEVCRTLAEVLQPRLEAKESTAVVSAFSTGEGRLLGNSVVGGLAMGRDESTIRKGLAELRGQVSTLARLT